MCAMKLGEPLVLRAGQLVRDGAMLKADPRKGLICISVDQQELIHFQWSERRSDGTVNAPEIDEIVFPGEVPTFQKVGP